MRKTISGLLFLCALIALATGHADVDPTSVEIYVRRPEVFADKGYYRLSADPRSPNPAGAFRWWYVRFPEQVGHSDADAVASFVYRYQVAGLDFTGQGGVGLDVISSLAGALKKQWFSSWRGFPVK